MNNDNSRIIRIEFEQFLAENENVEIELTEEQMEKEEAKILQFVRK